MIAFVMNSLSALRSSQHWASCHAHSQSSAPSAHLDLTGRCKAAARPESPQDPVRSPIGIPNSASIIAEADIHQKLTTKMNYLSTHNLTFHAIPVSLVIAAVPHWYAVGLYDRNRAPGTRRWDVSAPTEVIRNLKDAKLPPAIHARFVRAEAAQNNGFTNVPLFCAAILACNYAGLSKRYMNYSVAFYLVSRILYNIAYITCTRPRRGLIRTIIFNAGLINLCVMFIKAGSKIM